MRVFSFGVAAAALISAAVFTSCNNGDYDAYPDQDLSGVVNPVGTGNPGSNENFDWGGTAPMSAKINGGDWLATTAVTTVVDGYTLISGTLDSQSMNIGIRGQPQAGEVYTFGTQHSASYASSYTDPNQIYASGFGAGGKVKITEVDSSHIKGLFYFNGKNVVGPGTGLDISYGYFDVPR